MIVAIAGAHGKDRYTIDRPAGRRRRYGEGLIRNPDHASDVGQQGADPVVCDLEEVTVGQIATAIAEADAAVFAAAAGPGSDAGQRPGLDDRQTWWPH